MGLVLCARTLPKREELVNMIIAQRSYEMNSKAVQTSDQMLARLAQL